MEGIERRGEAAPDGGRAGDRELLAHDDVAQSGKTGRPPPQPEAAGPLRDRFQSRIGLEQGFEARP